MIENNRQYDTTSQRLSEFQESVRVYDLDKATVQIGSSVLANAELNALKSEVEVLAEQIQKYRNKWESTDNGEHHVQLGLDNKILRYHSAGHANNCSLCQENFGPGS